MNPQTPLILVVGMHRSGTSLLGSLLPVLGVPMPGPLIQADPHNPEGYFERADITSLQEDLLISLGRWWPSAAGADPLPASWLEHRACLNTGAALAKLLQHEQDRLCSPWAIKDPRTSLLLPLWHRIAAERQLPLKLVLSVRDPAEVMVSLLQRDTETAGMTAERTQQLWWAHNRRVLLDGSDLPMLVVDYGAWFEPHSCRRQLQQLARFCLGREAGSEILAEAASRIRPAHRRSRRGRRELPAPLHPWTVQLHRRLQRLAAAGTPTRPLAKLQHWLQPPIRSRLPAAQPGPWFDRQHYRRQCSRLPRWIDPVLHYRLLGWRQGISPHPLFEPSHYRHLAHLQGIATPGPPLLHFLNSGLEHGLPPSALADPHWAPRSTARLSLWQQARLEGLHPWGTAALAVNRGDRNAAVACLRHWQSRGLSQADLQAIEAAAPGQFSGDALQPPEAPKALPRVARVISPGCNSHDWQLHAWMQHLPLPHDFELCATATDTIHVLLGPLPEGPASLALIPLAGQPWVFASDPACLPVLQRLGIQAQVLRSTHTPANGWLNQPGDESAACAELGLPMPTALALQIRVLTLGSSGTAWERQLAAPIGGWPGFAHVVVAEPHQARLLASWLNACNRLGLQLVRLEPSHSEQRVNGWRALTPPNQPPHGWLPPQCLTGPIHPDELFNELAWRAAGCPAEPAVVTPQPEHRLLVERNTQRPADAAVCISLHNYADRILTALESVRAQSLAALELIVVDDASSDDGPRRVHDWLEQHGNRFSRALLVQHTSNAGLAAARNTAFALAKAAWCFVLDADNTLEPSAVADCLALAIAAPVTIAVVHPLVERVPEGDTPQEGLALISGLSWQRHHFLERNVVDAMALVRLSAWQAVGGYDHIRGGWEDYDFWCKLIEAGFQGVLCPQRLARYHCHAGSMLTRETHRQLRRISRLLQQRHPWLQLNLASEHLAQLR
ncbi:MAG: glycosyltransferase [Cyanobacteria bacterium K_Offshore_0m_m2_072]|nr:glycosyltransferase [Cyanobacteria bacterium K_Offshore_0m_m2_072]